jgi:hypothetical protein
VQVSTINSDTDNMKLKLVLIMCIVLLGTGSLTFTSCNKYEDGPTISLRTKKARLTNEWKRSESYLNGTLQTTAFVDILDIKTDYTYSKWDFSSDKESVTFTPDGSSSATTLKILKLKTNELWFEETDGTDIYESHYVPN